MKIKTFLLILLSLVNHFIFAQQNTTSKSVKTSLIGLWQNSEMGFQMVLKLNEDGSGELDGEKISFSADNSNLIVVQNGETITYRYVLTANNLKISGGDLDEALIFTKSGPTKSSISQNNTITNQSSSIDKKETSSLPKPAMELVGKWCYVNVNSYNNGGSSTEECILLNANGTYQYGYESNRSVNTDSYSGGTHSSSSDNGTWWVKEGRIYYVSKTGKGEGSYSLQKQNHPKNNDPMIVLEGRTFVTQYQKNPW